MSAIAGDGNSRRVPKARMKKFLGPRFSDRRAPWFSGTNLGHPAHQPSPAPRHEREDREGSGGHFSSWRPRGARRAPSVSTEGSLVFRWPVVRYPHDEPINSVSKVGHIVRRNDVSARSTVTEPDPVAVADRLNNSLFRSTHSRSLLFSGWPGLPPTSRGFSG